MNIWPGVHFIPLSSTSAEYDGVWFSAGSASLTPVLSVCISLVILAPVTSSAHYLLQLFPRSDFFLLSNECVLKCSVVQYFTQNILIVKADSRSVVYRFILFYFMLYICIYVAPWSCETRHLVPLYVHTCSGMTIKLNLT